MSGKPHVDARPSGLADLPALGDADFAYLRRLLHEETGIHLSIGKRAFVAGRLSRRLRELGLATYAEYCLHLRAAGEGERIALFDALCTHETRFFREPAHFDILTGTLLPRWREAAKERRRGRQLRIWSAGCATGEEPYSLAMALLHAIGDPAELTVEILATDLSTRAIEAAREGVFPLARSGEIAEPLLKAFMLKGRGRWEGRMRAGPEIRSLVRFDRLNLHRTPYELAGGFDAIFCRNVLIYFDAPTRARVVGALLSKLSRDGLLFVGHAEGLHSVTSSARAIAASVYAPRRPEGEAP